MRVFIASSSRSPWFESQNPAEHMKFAPYSVDAIGTRLAELGHTVNWAGWPTTHSLLTLARRIDALAPDIVYTYGAAVSLNPLLCRRFLCRYKAFKVVHGWDDHYGRIWGDIAGWLGRIAMNWMEKRIVKNSDAVVTLSYELQKIGRRWGVECEYIPNGADPVDDIPRSNRIKLEGRFKLVYTGDKSRWKRTEDICAAMRKVPKDIKLYLTGRNAEYLKPYASDNCIFLGYLTRDEQMGVMAQADAFVCTSDQDCNAKLQEYLRWKKPILAFDGEPNNFFKNGETALLAPNGDYAPLILQLAEDPALCRRIAECAACEIPIYSWIEIAKQFESYFTKLLRNG